MKKVLVRKNVYVDSVFLMLISRDLEKKPGVLSATVTMGTPMNVDLLRDQGFNDPALDDANASDLLLAVECGPDEAIETVFHAAEEMLSQKTSKRDQSISQETPHSIDDALEINGELNLAIISLPGLYAAREARKALQRNLHVMLFSDNVSLEDEIALKRLARAQGLLLMGPDCGTAIISGRPLCFSNRVSQGCIGIVAASGTGLQEVSCLIDRFGQGVSQAIGTGGRDLKNDKIGGLTMIAAIEALGVDDSTKVIVVISKPPAPEVANTVLDTLRTTGKPSVVHFIGLDTPALPKGASHWARNLEETARLAVQLAENPLLKEKKSSETPFSVSDDEIEKIILHETKSMKSFQKFIRGYFTGGTLADEAWLLLHGLTGEVYSNNQVDPAFVLKDPHRSIGHTVVDLGDDVFTVGRPHPMIDPSTRTDRIDAECVDQEIAVMLVDCVLGYGSHENPAGAMLPSLIAAKQAMAARGGYLSVIASVTGTNGDLQGYAQQVEILRDAGIIVMASNYQASMLAVRIMEKVRGLDYQKATNQQRIRMKTAVPVSEQPLSASVDSLKILDLFRKGPIVVNIGLSVFAESLRDCGASVVEIDWRPPAKGNAKMLAILDTLETSYADSIQMANDKAVKIILKGKPIIEGIAIAREVVPGMRQNLILHAGPPITWDRMCGPMRGAVIGALIYEGLAKDPIEAEELAGSGKIDFEPCHHHDAVGPMAGIMTSRMPVWIIRNETYGNTAFATLNEGLGKVLRYGAYSDEVLDRLRWMENVLAPILSKAIILHGPIDLRSLIVQALQMGDDGHNRNRAGTSLLIRELAPYLVLIGEAPEAVSKVFAFMHANDHFFLNLTMPAAKCVLDAASGIEHSTVITAMARNGTDFGIRLSGLGNQWFTGPASMVQGLYLPGFGPLDAAPDIGDSVITETSGIGGFAMAASPAIVKFVGGSPMDAISYTKQMYSITLAENEEYRIPILDFRGTPTAIDVRKVVETGILPVINTGIAHKKPGIGMVGAGLVKPPENCFRDALEAFARTFT